MAFTLVGQLAERLDNVGLLVAQIRRAPWIVDFEQKHGRRLPASFRYLVTRYAFRPFEWGSVLFFGNAETDHPCNLHIAATQDQAMWPTLRHAGMIQLGRPHTGGYDPICLGSSSVRREPSIIQVDHESILVNGRIKIVREIVPNFLALAELLMADGSGPCALEG
jgi:hypothetical protein